MRNFIQMTVIAFLTISCNMNVTSTNDENDRKEAEKIIDDFYFAVLQRNYVKIDTFFSSDFFVNINRDTFADEIESNSKTLGDLVTWDIKGWETVDVSGTNALTEYILQLDVEYSNHKSVETFFLRKEKDHIIRIVKYDIVSNAFKNIGTQ